MLQSVQTALQVFETVAKSDSIGVSEVARTLNISKSTAQRCLQALHGTGWIKADESAGATRWTITSKAFSLGQRVTEHGHLREMAMPVMSKLWEALGQSIHLVVAEGRKAIMLDQYESPTPVRMQVPRLAWAPLHTVPSGKVMLAHFDSHLLEQYITSGLEAITAHTITDPKKLRKELTKVRIQGWAISIDEIIEGYSAAAAPIFSWDGRNIAALAFTLPTVRFSKSIRKKYITLLVGSAAEISRRLENT